MKSHGKYQGRLGGAVGVMALGLGAFIALATEPHLAFGADENAGNTDGAAETTATKADGSGTGSSGANRSPAGYGAARYVASDDDKNDEYNFSWLDPDKKIYVLQNRKFSKANHLMLSVMAGPGLSNPYRNTFNVDPRMAYYFSEQFGIEAFYTVTSNSPNNTFEALQAKTNTLPIIREIRSQMGALLHYAPFYAKINLYNTILYFDWYFSAGAGTVHSALESRVTSTSTPTYTFADYTAFFAGTGHQYHLSQHFLVRLDFTGAFFQVPKFGNEGAKTWSSQYNFGIGLGLKL